MISIFRHRQRDDEAFDELFRSAYPALYRHAYAILHDEEDSRDIVSDIFTALLEKRKQPLPSVGYLMAMVHNRALDMLRHRRVEDEARVALLEEGETLMFEPFNDERLGEILRFVEAELTPQTQRVLRLCYDDKKSYRQVADELGISIQAVNKHISQALRKLRERFNPQTSR